MATGHIFGIARNRLLALTATLALAVMFVVLGANVVSQLRVLSTAPTDNLQWSILQVETEIANFRIAIADAGESAAPDTAEVRLRGDVALSRLSMLGRGRVGALFDGNAEAARLISRLGTYANELVAVLDHDPELTGDDLGRMATILRTMRPDVRQLMLTAAEAGTRATTEGRKKLARLLALTGLSAVMLIAALAVTIGLLDRLLGQMRQRDRALEATTARLTKTVAASLNAIVIANLNNEIVDFNEAAVNIFGWTRDEMIGRKLDETIIPPRHRAGHAAGMRRYAQTHEPRLVDGGRVELTGLRKSGEEFPIELNVTSVKDDEGELFIGYMRDISARMFNERQLIAARDRAQIMDRAKSQFLAVMSHEMRRPLDGILAMLDLLRGTPLDDRQERHLRLASASGEILLGQVDEALDIARIEMGSLRLSPQPFDLRPTVERIVDGLAPLAQEKGLSITLDFGPKLDGRYYGDGGRLAQILTTLIGNAIRFTDRGQITVRVSGLSGHDATTVTLAVEDSGGGIGPESLDDIFDDFVAPAQGGARRARGDGLGLSISRKIARMMGGDMGVTSTVGDGSIFTLTVPLPDQTRQPGRTVPPR